jgi:hypothetical protein
MSVLNFFLNGGQDIHLKRVYLKNFEKLTSICIKIQQNEPWEHKVRKTSLKYINA